MQGGRSQNQTWLDRNSGEMDLDLDLEAGRGGGGVPMANMSQGSSLGQDGELEDEDENGETEWNQRHPCFPHLNPHVPKESKEYENTRIIRISREYMYSGDLSPAYSAVYPEILDSYVDETKFREVIKRVNEELYAAHSPWSTVNILEGIIGLFTLWLYEDLVDTNAKKRIGGVEKYLESVNETLEKETGAKFIPLRRTGFLTVSSAGSVVVPKCALTLLLVA
jgi:hypothetical protein